MRDGCHHYGPNGWCRNKVVTHIPRPAWKDSISYCRKHADKKRDEILAKHAELVWALERRP